MTEKAQTRAKAEAQRLAKETPGQKETREKEEALLTEKAHQAQAAKKDALQETAAAMQANAIRIKTEAKERKQAKRKAKLEKKAEQAKLNTEAEAKKQQEKDIEEEENRRGQKKSLLTSTSTAETNVDKILSGVKKFETDASFIETNEYDTWKRDTKTKYKELSQEEKKLLSPLEGNWGWKILEKAAWFPNYFNKFAQLTEKKASKIELTADEASLYTVLLKVLS